MSVYILKKIHCKAGLFCGTNDLDVETELRSISTNGSRFRSKKETPALQTSDKKFQNSF